MLRMGDGIEHDVWALSFDHLTPSLAQSVPGPTLHGLGPATTRLGRHLKACGPLHFTPSSHIYVKTCHCQVVQSLQVGESGPMPRRANSWHSYGQSFHRAHFSSHLILFPPLLSRPLSPHSVASHMVMILVLSLAFSRCLTGFVPLVTPFPSPQP